MNQTAQELQLAKIAKALRKNCQPPNTASTVSRLSAVFFRSLFLLCGMNSQK
ncbi:hypothetical protein QUA82_11610 [Microcoleus sp. F8-D3]